jgi:hypothetical protein
MRLLITAVTLFLVCCNGNSTPMVVPLADRVIQYSVGGDRYAVVVVEDGVSSDEARLEALQQAAEKTVEVGKRYFVVETEEEVTVMKTSPDLDEQEAPHNQYYEMIQSNGFSKQQVQPSDSLSEDVSTGYRIVFRTYKKQPTQEYYDAEEMVNNP